jgi:nucleoside 2-deoxyribosyltransferase
MKFYLASSFKNLKNAALCIEYLEGLGHTCTHNWTLGVLTDNLPVDQRRAVANEQIQGVSDADFVVGLFPIRIGSSIELGAALGLKKVVYLVGAADPYEMHFFDIVNRRFGHIHEITNNEINLDCHK